MKRSPYKDPFYFLTRLEKEEVIMDLVIKENIEQLIHDAQEVKGGLKRLKRDHTAQARGRQQYDLKQLMEHVKGLEFDVSILRMMLSDRMSVSLGYQKNESWHAADILKRAFAVLDVLFNDLKQVRMELNNSYIHPDELKQLEIDWDRFRKRIWQIQKSLQDGEHLLKIKNVLPSSD